MGLVDGSWVVVRLTERGGSSCANRTITPAARGRPATPNQWIKEGMAVTTVKTARPVTGGVDTHLEVNVAAALDGIGGLLGVEQFKTTPAGNRQLLGWLAGFGTVVRVGVEGTGSYGASLARYLRRAGVEVVEVDRPNRQERRRKGKTDTVDAIQAAHAAQGDRLLGQAKHRDGTVEAIRALMVAKRSARSTKVKALNQIRHLGFTAPEEIRRSLQGVAREHIAKQAAARGRRPRRPGRLRHQDGATQPGPTGPGPRHREARPRLAVGRAGPRSRPRAAGAALSRSRHRRRPAGHRRRQPGPAALRGGLGPSVRGVAHRGVVGQGHPPPAQPRRRPPSQLSPVGCRHHPAAIRPPHPGLHGPPPGGRPIKTGDHPGPQTLCRPRGLQTAASHLKPPAAVGWPAKPADTLCGLSC